jgi:transposase
MSDLLSLPPAPCPECGILRAALEQARQQIAQLQAEIRELRSQLQRNSSNSSSPPSLDPPGAPKPVVKAPTGRKPGGQPGHPGHHRHRLPPARVTDVVPFVPTVCAHCQAPLPHNPAPGDPEPTWHQVAEVPVLAAVITEYQGHARTCPCCGHTTRAEIPPEIRAHVVGPNLAAILSYFSGRHHLGKRGIEELVETVFEVPISLGMVTTLESEMSAALAPAHDEAKDEVRAAAVKNADETGWKQAGRRCWLWMAATATVAYFVIHARRNVAGLQALLGEAIQGIVGSDRWGAYNKLPLHQRQICWAHLKRDFQKLIDRGGPAEAIGRVGMDVVECLFADWWAFRRGDLDRAGLQARLDPMARELQEALEQGCGCADPKAVAFCENVLVLYPALWLFAAVEGVEPTNNHAERLLRLGVLWRKNAFGSHSEAGCQFAARMLTVVQTLRLQKRPVLDYLRRAMIAHRSGLPAPHLLGQMGD